MEKLNKICIKAKVTGRVQGVGFRFHTAHQGLKLNLTGYARNESDGSVTVLACGEQTQVEKLLHWLAHGPDTARVTAMQYQEQPWRAIDGFSIR